MAKLRLTDEMLKEIEKYAALGLWEKDIANILGYSENYFYGELKQLHPQVSVAIKSGRSKLKAKLLSEIRVAGGGQWQANAWLCERLWQDEFVVKQKLEHSGNMTVNFDKQDKAL